MSSYPRGVFRGVVHYCDSGWWTGKDGEGANALLPWCLLDIAQYDRTHVPRADPPPHRREPETCLLCMGLRRRR